MHEKGIDDYSDEDVSVIIVWMPMFPGDSEAGAIEAYDKMSMHRVFQFWDPEALSGAAYSQDVYPTAHQDIAKSLAEDHSLKDRMMERAKTQSGRAPMWDFAAFYPAGVEWVDTPPTPELMIEQFLYAGAEEDGGSSSLWVDSFTEPPVRSDWFDLVEMQMQRLMEGEEE